MPPWMMYPWSFPMGQGQGNQEDPFKMYKKFRRFLKTEHDESKKKHEGSKRHEVWGLALFLLLSMAIVGPGTLIIIHMIEQSVTK